MYNKNALNNRLIIKRIMVLFGCVISCSMHIWMAENVNASIKSERDLYFLSLAQGSEICYKNYAKDSISAGNMGFDYLSIFKDGYDGQSNSDFLVTTQVGNKIEDGSSDKAKSDLSCKQLFRGWKDGEGDQAGGLINGFGYSAPNNVEGMGYVFGSGEAADVAVISLNLEKASSLQIGVGENRIFCKGEQDNNGKWKIKNCNGKIELKSSDTVIASVEYDGIEWDGREKRHKCDGEYVKTFPSDSVTACNQIPKWISGTKVHENLFEELEWMDVPGVSQRDDDFKTGSLLYGFEWFFQKALTAWSNRYDAWRNLIPGTHEIEVNYKNDECDTDNTICFSTHATKGGTNNGVNTYVLANENPSYASGVMLYNIMGKNVNTNLPHTLDGNSVAYHWKASNGNNAYIYSLYYYYLLNLRKKFDKISFGGDGLCWSESEGQSKPEGVEYAFKNTKDQWCSINLNNQIVSGHEVAYVNNAGTLEWGSIMNVLTWFNDPSSYDFDESEYLNMELKDGFLDPETADIDESTMPADPNASGTVAATCQSSGGAGAVGWIVCPILEWMGNSATHLYTDYVEPRLKINPKLFQTLENSEQNPTQSAWTTFQTIANVVFIILLLVVIFSQLTGIGIDNYGIKRILPKLIVVAILVNLSYLICVVCVDLSNILGGSLKGLFDSLGASLPEVAIDTGVANISALGNDSWVPVVLFGLLVTFIIVGAVSIAFNPAILLTLLISGIGVVISVLFIFVLFAVREAAIVVLTVVAPIAFVCYALPNTKKVFDKWSKAWQGLLLVYPICGLLIGGGDYISRLLITVEGAGVNETGFFPLMTAMVVGIAPIFFIPTLLKGSFAAMGNIGAKVSGVGKALSGRATKAATNSGINKRAQEAGTRHRDSLRSGYRMNKKGEMVERRGLNSLGRKFARTKFGRAIGADRRAGEAMSRYASSAEARYKDKWAATAAGGAVMMANSMARRSSEKEKMYSDNFARETDRGVIEKAFVDSLKGGDKELASTSMRSLIERGGVTEVFNALEGADWDNMDSNVRSTIVQAMGSSNVDALKSFSKYRSTGGSASFSEWTTGKLSDEHARLDRETNERAARENRGGIKDGTYSSHLQEIGQNALSSYSKDEMQLVQRNADSLRESMGKDKFGTMVMNSAINNNDSKSQNVANDIIKSEIKNSHLEATNMGLTADKISRMADNTAEALQGGYVERGDGMSEADARGVLSTQLANEIQGVNNEERLRNQTSNGVKAVFGIGGGGTNSVDSGTPVTPDNSGAAKQGEVFNLRDGAGGGDAPSSSSSELYMRGLSDDTVLDMATNPNAAMDDVARMAAVREYERREAEKAPYEQWLQNKEEANQEAAIRRESGERVNTVPQEENFDGETNINRKSGKKRTSGTFDLYPRQIKENGERENNAEYTARIQHNAQLRRVAEVAPPAPQMHFHDSYRKSQVDPPRGTAIPSDVKERAKLFHRRPNENPEAYKTRLGSDNPWG